MKFINYSFILAIVIGFLSCSPADMGQDPGNGDYDEIKVDYKNLSYVIDGKRFKMVLVNDHILAPFYIMQTELPSDSYFLVGDHYIGVLDSNADGAVIKAEFKDFMVKLREVTGLDFRLPTIAEWRSAAKGGDMNSSYTYSGSDEIDDVAWYKGNSGNSSHEIATKMPNGLGLYDMSGNYGDLCNDSNDEYYVDGQICGGCWNESASSCTVTSYKKGDSTPTHIIPGTSSIREYNAFDGKYIAVRLVYSIPE